jgi:long-chain acyl-CoA synthetase
VIRPPLHRPDRGVHSLLWQAADRYPERVALRHDDAVLTFRELEGCVNAFSSALAARGVTRGSRVALAAGNRPEWIIAHLAVQQAGGAVVMVNPQWKPGEFTHALAVTRPQLAIADAAAAGSLAGNLPGISLDRDGPAGWGSFWDELAAHPGTRPADAAGAGWGSLDAVLPFSSGTTGLPKAVRHTHASLLANVMSWKSAALIGEDDRLLFFFPLFHVYGVMAMFSAIASGASLRLHGRFEADAVLSRIEQERITISFAAAPVAVTLAAHDELERYDLSSLRYLVWGATPMVTELAARITARTGVPWIQGYGASEAPILHATPVKDRDQWRLDSPGLPVSDLRVKVVDLATRAELPPGACGEILVSGPNVMAGYLPDSANSDAFEEGWLRTGDVGWVEPDGWIHLTDRAKEMLKVNAFQVAPAELEQVLFSHPAVVDCCVYGLPDRVLGELPKAAVVLSEPGSVSAEELMEWVARHVAAYKRIRAIAFCEAIPRTPSGKALRRELRAADVETADQGRLEHDEPPLCPAASSRMGGVESK